MREKRHEELDILQGSIIQRMANTLSLLWYFSIAALVEQSQRAIKLWEDTAGALIG